MEHLFGSLEPFVRDYGAAAVGVVLFFESLGLPLPGESLLVFSGLMAGRGELSVPGLLIAAWIGAVAGDNAGYLIGRAVGRSLVIRYGSRIGLTEARYARVEATFDRWGPFAVAFARFFNVLRQLNGVAAGTAGMHWLRFLAFNALGAAAWVAVWGLGAVLFGTAVEAKLGSLEAAVAAVGPWRLAGLAAVICVAAAAAIVVVRRRRA